MDSLTEKHGMIVSGKNICLEWSAVRYPMKGEPVCGDLFQVSDYQGRVLVAVSDGLGHGVEALKASRAAMKSVSFFPSQSLIAIATRCHENLMATRGAVMNLGIVDCGEQTLTWLGIGNIEGILYRAGKKSMDSILSLGGVVGYKMPTLKASIVSISPGDTLIFTTDGVEFDFDKYLELDLPPDVIVENIASGHIKQSDDALIFVARYTGTEFSSC